MMPCCTGRPCLLNTLTHTHTQPPRVIVFDSLVMLDDKSVQCVTEVLCSYVFKCVCVFTCT